jgi:hypothetical protein
MAGYFTAVDMDSVYTSACFVASAVESIRDQRRNGKHLSVVQQSLLVVQSYFDDMMGVHPLLCRAMSVGSYTLRNVVSVAIYNLRLCFLTMSATDNAIEKVISSRWDISTSSEFYTHFAHAVSGCAIQYRLVKPDHSKHMEILVDGTVGMIITTVDKLIILLVLMFTYDIDMFNTIAAFDRYTLIEYGVPGPICQFITNVKRAALTKTVGYYGQPDDYPRGAIAAPVDEWAD